jgi:hypothetical protein
MATIPVCQGCREELRADDQVVAAIRQTEVTHRDSTAREYVDGAQVLFHLRHWSRSRAFREIYRGRLSGAPQTGG